MIQHVAKIGQSDRRVGARGESDVLVGKVVEIHGRRFSGTDRAFKRR